MKIYLASPLFSEEERERVEVLAKKLRENPLNTVYVPQESEPPYVGDRIEWANKVFTLDKENIDSSDKVVAIYYGNYSDSGTAWEVGYANGINRPVDVLLINPSEFNNLMLICHPLNNIYSYEEYVSRESIIKKINI